MAWTKPTTLTSWSFSRYNSYGSCPLACKLSNLDKIKAPPSPPMARGDAIHKIAEAYVKGETSRTMPKELKQFDAFFRDKRKRFKEGGAAEVQVETTWALRKDWSTTTWNDWDGCWLRIKVDLCYAGPDSRVYVADYKTGKFSPEYNVQQYLEQLDLYALGALIVCKDYGPDLRVIPQLYYLDHGIIYPELSDTKIYTPDDLPRLKQAWTAKTKAMLADKTFAPKPNRFCGSCHYRAANKANGGGQCLY